MITSGGEFYKENGYLLVKGCISKDEVEEMKKGVGDTIQCAANAKHDRNHAWQVGDISQHELKKLVLKGFYDVQYHDAQFKRAAIHPNMVSVLQKLIGPNVQLHHSKMLVKPPEKGVAFPMHQDHPYFPHEIFKDSILISG